MRGVDRIGVGAGGPGAAQEGEAMEGASPSHSTMLRDSMRVVMATDDGVHSAHGKIAAKLRRTRAHALPSGWLPSPFSMAT